MLTVLHLCAWTESTVAGHGGVHQHRVNRRQRFDSCRRQPSSTRREHRSTLLLVGKKITPLIPQGSLLVYSLWITTRITTSHHVVGTLSHTPIRGTNFRACLGNCLRCVYLRCSLCLCSKFFNTGRYSYSHSCLYPGPDNFPILYKPYKIRITAVPCHCCAMLLIVPYW